MTTESRRPRDSWADRHPAAAVTAGLFTLVFTAMMLSTHPIAAVAMIGIAGIVGFAVLVDRERQRRGDCAARAERDYQRNAELIVSYDHGRELATVKPSRPRQPAPWHLISLLPTQPLHTTRN
ncbi:MAG TPA: hypothetical protein VFR27_03095 [Mycobacterium sp.]|nr:hypothetical protein [Mycobacterium sp.]